MACHFTKYVMCLLQEKINKEIRVDSNIAMIIANTYHFTPIM